ncbi:MAG: sulfotransferase domain-containing protein [Planctomycetaceae bacterium]|jgi:hypothetical protein|nr:sulfotransferase domain-containing protein [Planctomycetaceae bacterium]
MKAIVHIGTGKTGTTTIQQFLSDNVEALESQKIFVPDNEDFLGWKVRCPHRTLWASFLNIQERKRQTMWKHFPYSTLLEKIPAYDLIKLRKKYERQFHKTSTVLFSEECFSCYLESEISSLKQWLFSFFDEVTIIVYLRRQPEYLVSVYAQQMKGGLPKDDDVFSRFLSNHVWNQTLYADDYRLLLTKWTNAFDKENIKIRLFDRKEMIQNDLLEDFCHTSGIDITHLKRPGSLNESFDAETIEFIKLVSKYFIHEDNYYCGYIAHFSENLGNTGNKGYNLSQAEAQEILDRYRESNNAVAREYLGREQLFSDDVSMYPVLPSSSRLTSEKCIDIFSVLWKAVIDDKLKIESELHKLERRRIPNRLKRLGKKIKKIPQRCVKFANKINKAVAALLMME